MKRIISQAWRSQNRRKAGHQKGGRIYTLATATAPKGEIVAHRNDPRMDTFAWSFQSNMHVITSGDRFAEAINTSHNSDREQLRLATQLFRHEADHGLWTTRELSRLISVLTGRGIPFALLNLFEDARIEHLDRCDSREDNRTKWFGWRRWYQQPDATCRPETFFWSIINYEGSHRAALTPTRWTGPKEDRKFIKTCYQRAIAAATTEDLLPVLEDWVKRFGRVVDDLPRVGRTIGGVEDPSDKRRLVGYGYSDEATTADGTQAGETPDNADTGETTSEVEDAELETFCEFNEKVDEAQKRDIVGVLNSVVGGHSHTLDRISTIGSRLNISTAAVGDPAAFRSTSDRSRTGPPTITVIVDMSGSMAGHRNHLRAFLAALGELHRAGRLAANIWLTGGKKRCRLRPEDHNFDALVGRLYPRHGSESIAATLADAKVRADMRNSAVTVCYTDGALTDGAVNAGDYRRQAIDLIGAMTLLPGQLELDASYYRTCYRAAMDHHFGRSLIADTPRQLARDIACYLLERHGRRR